MTDLAATFHGLHQNTTPLRLANAWDAGSARLIESVGAPAIATTSAGVAWAQGYPDGDTIPVRDLAAVVAAITRVIRIPLSVDVEGGYAADPAGAGETIAAILDAGAVGINIEDGRSPADLLASKIEAIKRVAAARGVDLFVNARIDVYLAGLVPEEERLAETIRRATLYREAGADGIFVPALTQPEAIRAMADATPLPLNVLAWRGLPPAAELATLGVRRLSAGSGIPQALWGRAAVLAKAFLTEGASGPLAEGAMTHPEINALFLNR
ncbi:MAG TPA: isocitrate lyase/phosphoenolpyruvate mutase family protein [Aliidongia sp.]|uniref:isocitrate lyase/PEP mutase family protein n=1 Tax=Aliidongia sp. TaxID=1914230 RepID=UPI002DDD0D39|nr:isocitrate lyase/phosphoenolpyruvate mutase family protein [Aliidongia sp.]HEV2676012.1 isocitrate lyase/phosphoenolpyruvate mutase family protein [Aliidongia sp.]